MRSSHHATAPFKALQPRPPGLFVPRGREDRTCIVVDTQPTATTARADLFLKIKPGSDFAATGPRCPVIADVPL